MTGIVVGVDGSDHSRGALSWAMREANLRQVPLEVVMVHSTPARPATEIYWGIRTLPENSFDPELARSAVQGFVGQVASDIGETLPEVTVTVVTGDVAEELVNASNEADMLVVGSRGSGGFTRLLMGSVSSQVSHHATCPVVIIPGNHRAS
jgi:nucleotide-binding universal stress UspA family protein